MAFNPVQVRELRIAGSGISSTETSITFRKMVLVDTAETSVTMAMFGTIGYITLEPKTDREENISFTGLTQNANGTATITGVTRGLEPDTPYAENSDFKFAHAGGAIAVVSNSSAYYSQFGKLANDEEITGQWEAPDPLTAQGIVTRDYMLGLINGGAISTNKVLVAGTAGETVAAGNLVYFDETDNEWKKTDADTAATVNLVLLGIAQGAGVNGGAISGGVLLSGLDENQSGMTQGDLQYASNTAGGISSTTGTTERVIGIARNATTLYFDPGFYYSLTVSQKGAIAGGSTFGTPSSTNKFITQDYNSSATGLPVIRTYTANDTWTKPAGLKYIIAEVTGGGGGGGGNTDPNYACGGGGGGGYSREIIPVASLGATEAVTVGAAGAAGAGTGGAGGTGGTSSFGTSPFLQATGGAGGATASTKAAGGAGGVGSSGTLNIEGQDGGYGLAESVNDFAHSGYGGCSHYGGGGAAVVVFSTNSDVGINGNNYGGGGSGAAIANASADTAGGAGAPGVVIITEFYS